HSSAPLVHVLFILILVCLIVRLFFFFTYTATTEIYSLSLHDALPISDVFAASALDTIHNVLLFHALPVLFIRIFREIQRRKFHRSEEHTSELQSRFDIVCRLLLEKKKIYINEN